jgi:hypothetical protein
MDRYLVFARAAYAEPLSYRGALELPAGESPDLAARETYGVEWVELVLVPEGEITWVVDEPAATSVEAQP